MPIEHSPAPWRGYEGSSPAPLGTIDWDEIAKVYLTNLRSRKRDTQHAGNLALIEAVPDMYACLLATQRGEDYPLADLLSRIEARAAEIAAYNLHARKEPK